MRRLIAVLLCAVLFAGCAFAEEPTRTGTIILEGMTEEFAEARYQSAGGYELWYPNEYLEAGKKYGHDCFYPVGAGEESDIYFMIVPSDADPADAEALLSEAVGGFGPEAAVGKVQMTNTLEGALMGRVQAAENGTVYRYYLIAEDQNVLLITACFPEEALEGFGVRFDRMAATIAFAEPDALYEGDGYSIGYFEGVIEPTERFGKESFAPVNGSAEAEIYLMIIRSDVSPDQADGLLDEAGGGYEGDFERRRSEEETLESGLTLQWVEVEQAGRIDKYYLIKGEQAVYCLSAAFPAEDEMHYGAYFDAMTESFRLAD